MPADLIVIVVGQDELDTRSVNVRNRDNVGQKGRDEVIPLDTVVEKLLALKKGRSLENKL
jgi:threonyl-tRNA synthetase